MWEQTLIESKGYGRGTKARWTMPLAAFLHVGLIAAVILASYWRVEAMEAPQSGISYVQSIPVALTPALLGARHQQSRTAEAPAHATPEVTQPAIVPQLVEQSSIDAQQTGSDQGDTNGSDLPEGVEWGIDGGDPNSSSPVGFGFDTAVNDEARKMSVNIVEPILIKRVEPEYPRAAMVAHIQGVVILEAIITKMGSVEQVKTLRADHALLEKAAKDAVLQWRYKPATLQGRPVKVYFTVTVTFHLR